MINLRKFTGIILITIYISIISLSYVISTNDVSDIPSVISTPRKSCSLGFSCNTSSCKGGSLIGICSKVLSNGYTLRIRGRYPQLNMFSAKYHGIPLDGTIMVLRIYDDLKKPFIDLHIGTETIGMGALNTVDNKYLWDDRHITKGIAIDRSISNFRNAFGDQFDFYLFYRNGYFSFLFKHKNGKYYEAANLKFSNRIISSIVPITGPVDDDILFEQSMTLNIPSTYVTYSYPSSNPSPNIYVGPFTPSKGNEVTLVGAAEFEDGVRVVFSQGGLLLTKGVDFTFTDYNGRVLFKLNICVQSKKYKLTFNNYNSSNAAVSNTFDFAKDYPDDAFPGVIHHFGFLISANHLVVCVRETCYVAYNLSGIKISRIKASVYFNVIQVYGFPEQKLVGSAIGKYKCKVGEVSCEGTEMRLTNPLSPGQQVQITTKFSEYGTVMKRFASLQQKDVFGAIVMGDELMRAAAFLSKNSVSMAVFSSDGVLIDSCSIYLSSSKIFDLKSEISVLIGLSSSNKLSISGILSGKKTQFCELDGSLISITRIRTINNDVLSNVSKFSLTNDYPAEGYPSISGGNALSRSNQQAINCYLTNNGNCNSVKAVQMDVDGLVKSTYLTVSSSSVEFPFVFEMSSATDNSLLFVITITSYGKLSVANLSVKDVTYVKLPPSCLERILFEGLHLLIASDESNVYTSICGYLVSSLKNDSLNKKLIYNFKSGGTGNNVKITNFPVNGGAVEPLEFITDKYFSSSTNVNQEYNLNFPSPCNANKNRVVGCTGSSVFNLAPQKFFTEGYSVIITGTVEKPTGSFEHALNQGISADNIIQIFSFRTSDERDMYQLVLTKTQMFLSVHDTNGINYYSHVGVNLPANVNLDEGEKYRIGLGMKDNVLHLFVEAPYGSGKYYLLRRRITWLIWDWSTSIYRWNVNDSRPVYSIVPILLVGNSYFYAFNSDLSVWYPKATEYTTEKEGEKSCTVPVYGTCTSTRIYMPENKPVYNSAILIFRFGGLKKSFKIYFKKEDGSIVAQFEMTIGSTMWNNNVGVKFKTNLEESSLSYNVSLKSLEMRVSYYGRGLGYHMDGYWRSLLALGENDQFNQILSSELDEFSIEYIRTSCTEPSPWQYFNYGSKLGKSSMILGYDQCNKGKPRAAHFASYNVYYQGSAIENMCSNSLHPDRFALVIKSTYPKFTAEEVAKTFPNFPGFLQAIVLMYNGGVVYTLVIARKYIVLFNSINDGNAGSFSSCASKTPNESEFVQGGKYYATFYIEGGYLQIYFHSYIEKRSALLCKVPYTKHFNSYKMLGQVNPSTDQSSTGLFYNFKRTLYSPTLSPNNLYPMGTVNTKNAVLSSGMPFSPNESLSILMNCNYNVIFGGQTGKPQLQLSANGNQISFKNIIGKLVATGELQGDCICKANKKILINLTYLNGEFILIACNTIVASILTAGASIYQISSEDSLKVIYRTDLRLAVATYITSSQISKVEEQPDTSKDEEVDENYFMPESFDIQPILHVQPSYSS